MEFIIAISLISLFLLIILKVNEYSLVKATFWIVVTWIIILLPVYLFTNNTNQFIPDFKNYYFSNYNKDSHISIFSSEFKNYDSTNWNFINKEQVSINHEKNYLIVTPEKESVWYRKDSAFFMYKNVEGDVNLSSIILPRKKTNINLPPDEQWQFGGIMLKDPSTKNKLNYVFIAIGNRGNKYQIEIKNTYLNNSTVQGISIDYKDAELRLKRKGRAITFLTRTIGSAKWEILKTIKRDDLPDSLQAGLIVYSYSYGKEKVDLAVKFQNFLVW